MGSNIEALPFDQFENIRNPNESVNELIASMDEQVSLWKCVMATKVTGTVNVEGFKGNGQ